MVAKHEQAVIAFTHAKLLGQNRRLACDMAHISGQAVGKDIASAFVHVINDNLIGAAVMGAFHRRQQVAHQKLAGFVIGGVAWLCLGPMINAG